MQRFSGWHTTTVLTKCAANVWPIGPIVRSQTCARMQRGDSPKLPWTFTSLAPDARRTLAHQLVLQRQSFRSPMLVADCKGVTALVLGTSNDVRLKRINTMLAEYSDQHLGAHRLQPLRLTNQNSDGWPICMNLRSRLRTHTFAFWPSEVCASVGLTKGR